MHWLRSVVHDLVLPRTDAGVAVQLGILVVLVAVGLYKTWRMPDLRRLVAGLGMFTLGLMAMRALH
ncbi:MAG: hypothetical protein ACR2KP_16915 [Egibacteraceae bacterium]